MENCAGNKRSRETSPEPAPESKRLHAEILLGILEEEDCEGAAGMDLATVMKSLEDEIAMPVEETGEGREAEIGYLLEASDDDLGIPPPATPPATAAATAKGWREEGFGEMWGFEEEMGGWCEGLVELGGAGEEEKFGEAEEEGFAAAFDGGLFDFSDFCWRPESLPTQ